LRGEFGDVGGEGSSFEHGRVGIASAILPSPAEERLAFGPPDPVAAREQLCRPRRDGTEVPDSGPQLDASGMGETISGRLTLSGTAGTVGPIRECLTRLGGDKVAKLILSATGPARWGRRTSAWRRTTPKHGEQTGTAPRGAGDG
jgi:hypothetical protein